MDLDTILTLGRMGYTKADIEAMSIATETPPPEQPEAKPAAAPEAKDSPALMEAIAELTAAVRSSNTLNATTGSPAGDVQSAEDILKLAGAGLLGKKKGE